MNGKILTNHVDHLDNFRKLQENNMITSENVKNSRKNNYAGLSSEKDNVNLDTIQEELQDTAKNNESSGDEDVSSLTSDTESDSDASLSDSSEEEIEFFPSKKSSKNNNINDEHLEGTIGTNSSGINSKHSTSEDISNKDDKDAKNSHDVTKNNDHGTVLNGRTTEARTEQDSPIIQPPNKLPRKLSPLGTGSHKNGQNQNEQSRENSLSSTGLQSIPTTSNNYGEQSTGGSSDVVIPSAHNPPDLIKGNLNSSGTVSDDSELKDHARILAELQKIVQDDEMHDGGDDDDGGQSEDDAAHGKNEGGITDSVVQDSSQSNNLMGRSDGGSDQVNTSTGGHGIKNGFHSNNHHDGKSTMKSLLVNSGTRADVGTGVNGTKNEPHHQNKIGHVGTMNGHEDGTKLQTSTHGNGTSHHGNSFDGHVDSGATTSNNEQKFDGGHSNDTTQEVRTNMKMEGTRTRTDASNSLHTTPSSSTTSLQTPATTQPANFANQEHSLENLEKKLSNLQISNTEQTAEIRRLKTLNQTLKTKFEKLEQSSSYHQKIEEKMLQRNEELEKHLLGMLKSQEIIFDMKENLKAASANNEKLTKDYKEAVKALEAVDKLVGLIRINFIIMITSLDKIRSHEAYQLKRYGTNHERLKKNKIESRQ